MLLADTPRQLPACRYQPLSSGSAASGSPEYTTTASQSVTPSRIAQALAPVLFGLLIEPMGRSIIVVSAGLSLAALLALMLLPLSVGQASQKLQPN